MAESLTFGKVDEIWDAAVVCGQGPSWMGADLGKIRDLKEDGVAVIAVNGAIESLGSLATHWFTLDFSSENRRRMRHPIPGVRYYAAVPPDYADRYVVHDHITYLKRIVKEEPRDGRPFHERVIYQIVGGLSHNPGKIHTGNSGFGAMGLAFLFGAKDILLLGIDGHGRERWDGSHNGDLRHLPRLFRSALDDLNYAGVQVVNGSPDSAVECFPRVTQDEGLDWLLEG